MNDNYITILNEDGVEELAEIIFTFQHQDENYVFLTLVSEFDDVKDIDQEYDVLVYKYEELENGEIGNLIEIPENDDEAWEVVEEMFETFQATEFSLEEE